MAENWHYSRNGKQFGPVSGIDLKRLAANGNLDSNDLIWKEGMANWVEAKNIKGLFPIVSSKLPPPVPTISKVLSPFTPSTQSVEKSPAISSEKFIKVFVGKNYDYYRQKWEILDKTKRTASWNWAAFFLAPWWLAYRKMYLYCFLLIGLFGFEIFFDELIGLPNNISSIIGLAIAFTIGWNGNYAYKTHVEKKIKEITATNTQENIISELERQGGTSIGSVIGCFAAWLAVIFIIVIFFAMIKS